jgi:NAD(P)-dependent dehydrogenase (short-subunit alcohol dehydrogenase family)
MANEMKQRLRGKVALITGGSRGIGRAIAGTFAAEAASVFICGRNKADVEKAVDEIGKSGGAISGRAADIGQEDQVERIVRAAAAQYGKIDVLVNNASALGSRLPIAEYPSRAWEEVLRVNLTGLFLVTKRVLQLMLPRQRGSIINVSSGVGRVGKARWGAYAVSKFGLEGFTQMVAEEVHDFGIRVNAVNPGPTRTKMRAEAYPDEDPTKLPQPDEITEVFTYLASDDSVQITGKSLDAQDWTKPRN